jgi:microcystin degradation protein MlrC
LKIAVGAMMHETNTFTTIRTGIGDFTCAEGNDVFGVQKWKGTCIAGIIDKLKAEVEIIPTFFARALPGGMVEKAAYEHMRSRIISKIRQEKDIDGICLALHGSMCAEGEDDPEGSLLEEIREIVGPEVPIVCSLDMHATMTNKMVDKANAFSVYRTAPHIDEYQTGESAAQLLLKSIFEGKKLKTYMKKLPILIAGEKTETAKSPVKELFSLLEEEDAKPGILRSSFALGFPWADSSHNGVAVLAVGYEEDERELEDSATRLANAFDDAKEKFDFTTEACSFKKAINRALADPTKPIIISDSGDNPTAGASQDLSGVVKILAERKIPDALVAVIADKRAYTLCKNAWEGAEIELPLGRLDPYNPNYEALTGNAVIKKIAEVNGTNYAVVDFNGINVVISELRVAVTDPKILEGLGLDLKSFKIIVLKSGYVSPEYQALSPRCILALTQGDTCEVLKALPYRVTPRPIFPLDKI